MRELVFTSWFLPGILVVVFVVLPFVVYHVRGLYRRRRLSRVAASLGFLFNPGPLAPEPGRPYRGDAIAVEDRNVLAGTLHGVPVTVCDRAERIRPQQSITSGSSRAARRQSATWVRRTLCFVPVEAGVPEFFLARKGFLANRVLAHAGAEIAFAEPGWAATYHLSGGEAVRRRFTPELRSLLLSLEPFAAITLQEGVLCFQATNLNARMRVSRVASWVADVAKVAAFFRTPGS